MFSRIVNAIKDFVYAFFTKSGIHGFSYVGNRFLHVIERLLWVILIGGALYQSVTLSLESWHRYLYASTVVAIERDHYYWNTSLPALTICPMERLSKEKLNDYVK
jgi:amiloride-sensitive sodium channel